jgi:hypothetical protein
VKDLKLREELRVKYDLESENTEQARKDNPFYQS